jgi:HEAT repeat protein
MLRTVRQITPIVSALVFGFAAVSGVTLASTVLIGCEDETKPEYFIKRLDDPAVRPAAVKRLIQFFEDAMTRADKNREDANVKALLDKIVPPLAKVYVQGGLDDSSRFEILKLLADSRDLRAKEAWTKALKDYQPNVSEDEAKNAARAIAKCGVRDQDALDAMVAVFMKLQAGSEKGGLVYKDFMESMTEISAPSWEPQLLERLNRPMEMVDAAKDKDKKDKITAYRNEQFWQITSSEILGNIKSAKATEPLFKCVVNPGKADVAASAVMAIVKIGKPAMPVLNDILLGKNAGMIEYSKGVVKTGPELAVVRTAALVIGTVGRVEGVKPLIEALGQTKDDPTKAIIARELSKLPSSEESLNAYVDVLMKMPVSVDLPTGETAAAMLSETVDGFYNPSVVDKLIKRGNDAKGSDEDKHTIRDSTIVALIHLMKKEQIEQVEKAINSWAPKADENKLEKEAFAKSKETLVACGDKIECYLAKIEEPALQEQKDQVAALKAAYMLGILGSADPARMESTRNEIIKRFPKIKNAAIKFASGKAVDHLTPNGDKGAADAIKKVMDDNKQKGDNNLILGDAPLKQIMFRILARL